MDKRASPQQSSSSSCCSCQRIKTLIVGVFVLVGLGVGLSYIWTGSPNPVDYFVPVDPPGLTEAIRWDAETGLGLVVENACDDTWTAQFDRSLSDWNKTDALNLETTRVAYNPECDSRFGRLKTCNGDYGDTNWRGINISILRNDVIAYSTSKLNDYHLKTDDQKLYTMCHELGHGFGLPHTDEDHFNRDRGDCMDYTNRPRRNLVPGQFNLDLLEELYGTPTVPRGSNVENVEASGTVEELTTPRTPVQNSGNERPNEEDEKDKENEDDRRRLLRGANRKLWLDEDLPLVFQRDVKRAEDNCEGEYCSLDLGDGYRVEIHKLLV